MRIAALSDIHGNLAALNAVLEDIRSQGVDLIVNLGDIASGPLQPSETVDQLMALNLPTIRGNHERQLLEEDRSRMGLSDQYAFDELRPDQLAWFASLPARRYVEDDVLLVHGSAESDLTYFMETLWEEGCRAATHDEGLSRHASSSAAAYCQMLLLLSERSREAGQEQQGCINRVKCAPSSPAASNTFSGIHRGIAW
ncbi:metallophosphoesterase family protein [Ralstonia sp. UBA689]|uniref:metallophosphoesterase family protein n=1 Tax=Ralstonia sp. UBA689 TaxID=1947373 RepID=UPI0039C917B9